MGPKLKSNLLLAITVASSTLFNLTAVIPAKAQQPNSAAVAPSAPSNPKKEAEKANLAWHASQGFRYQRDWGIDIVGVRVISSGEMLEFRYRIVDTDKSKPLNDKENKAVLTDEATGAKLTVPQMEKVGLLRTATDPKIGRIYWMIFANEKHIVKTGSRVSIDIGKFHVSGLVAE